jgi:hypothetical protein
VGELAHVLGHAQHAVRVGAPQVGLHQGVGQQVGVVGVHAGLLKDAAHQLQQLVGGYTAFGCDHGYLPVSGK